MRALKLIKRLEDFFVKDQCKKKVSEQVEATFIQIIEELEELQKDEMFILLQELKEVNNTDSNDFLDHIKRTAKAILKKSMR